MSALWGPPIRGTYPRGSRLKTFRHSAATNSTANSFGKRPAQIWTNFVGSSSRQIGFGLAALLELRKEFFQKAPVDLDCGRLGGDLHDSKRSWSSPQQFRPKTTREVAHRAVTSGSRAAAAATAATVRRSHEDNESISRLAATSTCSRTSGGTANVNCLVCFMCFHLCAPNEKGRPRAHRKTALHSRVMRTRNRP